MQFFLEVFFLYRLPAANLSSLRLWPPIVNADRTSSFLGISWTYKYGEMTRPWLTPLIFLYICSLRFAANKGSWMWVQRQKMKTVQILSICRLNNCCSWKSSDHGERQHNSRCFIHKVKILRKKISVCNFLIHRMQREKGGFEPVNKV